MNNTGYHFSAIAKMQKKNIEKYGINQIGPFQPECTVTDAKELDLKQAVANFFYKSCEGLKYEKSKESEFESGEYTGKSMNRGEIPYNMQMDIDRLTFAKAVERFIESGNTYDAFDVYFAYLEIFIGEYEKCNRMVDLLSEFEKNGSSMLMKHRDHYVHSVYVFILGLAIFETNEAYRETYRIFYKDSIKEGQNIAHHFLEYWGLTSLFHDIGYPFELPFEQVESYFEERELQEKNKKTKRKNWPYISYNNLSLITELSYETRKRVMNIYGWDTKSCPYTTDELFAWDLEEKLGETYHITAKKLCDIFMEKPINPDKFGYFMDHAYFSATVLFKELSDTFVQDGKQLNASHIDALTAIIMHNSLYKFAIAFYKEKGNKPFKAELHPLAYMLMLCDELQCWDRTSYGRNSRSLFYPFDCKFKFSNNAIKATYMYDDDKEFKEKIENFEKKYTKYIETKKNNPLSIEEKPELKVYGEMINENEFLKDIERIVSLDKTQMCLEVGVELGTVNRKKKKTFLSDSNFLHLYRFAVAMHAQYSDIKDDTQKAVEDFNKLSLEYKFSNILQAKKFSEYLNELSCFYTDRSVDFDMKSKFDDDELVFLGEKEHIRWENEKKSMGWSKATDDIQKLYKNKDKKAVREQLRMHHLIDENFAALSYENKLKDQKPLNTMMIKLREFEGIRIYKYK